MVKDLIALRRDHPALGTAGTVQVRHAGYPLVYERRDRDDRFLVVINPSEHRRSIRLPADPPGQAVLGDGVRLTGGHLEVDAFGHAIRRY